MKIGDVVKFKSPVSGAFQCGPIVWMDTANVRGIRKTLLEVEVDRNETRLVYKDQILKIST